MGEESISLKYRNILIITENFTFGGLETHLYGKIKHLFNGGYNIFLVIGASYLENSLPSEFCKKIYTNFKLGSNTSHEVVNAAYDLVEIIRKNEIDVVDVHPFFSALPAFFAASLTKTPFIYTMHGPASIMEDFGQFNEWFTKCILFESASLVSNVSKEAYLLTKNHVPNSRNAIFKNSVDIDVFLPTYNIDEKFDRCCIVSRLDSAKVNGIKEFITLATNTNIREIDIYGDGPEYGNLIDWLSLNKEQNNISVSLKGACFDVCAAYKSYPLVAGMGRVALEAAASNIPVILVGYDGVKGVLDRELIERASNTNLSGRGLSNISGEALALQLARLKADVTPFRLSEWVSENANEKRTWTAFSEKVQSLSYHSSELANDVFCCLEYYFSDIPLATDETLLNKIKAVLRSNKYIGSSAYLFMQDYDLRSSNTNLAFKQSDFESYVKMQLDEVLMAHQKKIQELNEQLLNKEILLQTLTQAKAEVEQRSAEHEARVQDLEAKLTQAKAEVEQRSAEHEARVQDLEAKLTQAKAEVEQRSAEHEARVQDLEAKLTQAKAEVEQRSAEHEARVQDLEAKLTQAKAEVEQRSAEHEAHIETLQFQLLEMGQKYNKTKLLNKSLQCQLRSLEVNLDWYKATFEDRSILGIIKDKAFKVSPKN